MRASEFCGLHDFCCVRFLFFSNGVCLRVKGRVWVFLHVTLPYPTLPLSFISYKFVFHPTHPPTHPPTYPSTHSTTHPPTHPLNHPPTHSPTHPPTHPPTHYRPDHSRRTPESSSCYSARLEASHSALPSLRRNSVLTHSRRTAAAPLGRNQWWSYPPLRRTMT